MQRPTSPQYRIAELIFTSQGHDLADWLERRRLSGASYDDIAHEVYRLTDGEVSVTYQTVKRWLVALDLLEVAS